ncbi:MAG TPA: hypothetical protein VMG62_07150, partial [Solirubrobacteraceae bacterium]|nr:hypothetical protein [Solirubrobacteraceae bacterium]
GGVAAGAGAAAQGASVSVASMVEAGLNCLPVGLLFLGLGALGFGVAPRASVGVAYGLVAVAFVWDLFGSLLGAPRWLVEASPFQHVGLVPAQPLHGGAAAAMVGLALVCGLGSIGAFARRDLVGA